MRTILFLMLIVLMVELKSDTCKKPEDIISGKDTLEYGDCVYLPAECENCCYSAVNYFYGDTIISNSYAYIYFCYFDYTKIKYVNFDSISANELYLRIKQ